MFITWDLLADCLQIFGVLVYFLTRGSVIC